MRRHPTRLEFTGVSYLPPHPRCPRFQVTPLAASLQQITFQYLIASASKSKTVTPFPWNPTLLPAPPPPPSYGRLIFAQHCSYPPQRCPPHPRPAFPSKSLFLTLFPLVGITSLVSCCSSDSTPTPPTPEDVSFLMLGYLLPLWYPKDFGYVVGIFALYLSPSFKKCGANRGPFFFLLPFLGVSVYHDVGEMHFVQWSLSLN